MGWESLGVVGFDLGLLLQGQTRIAKPKSAYNLQSSHANFPNIFVSPNIALTLVATTV